MAGGHTFYFLQTKLLYFFTFSFLFKYCFVQRILNLQLVFGMRFVPLLGVGGERGGSNELLACTVFTHIQRISLERTWIYVDQHIASHNGQLDNPGITKVTQVTLR